MKASRFITLEGGEGSGKSTQLKLLSDKFSSLGIDHIVTREPGGSAGADLIRALLVTGEVNRWDGTSEALLHFAARRDHVEKTIKPALDAGRWVLCDRFFDSTTAYQGYGHGLDLTILKDLQRISIGEFSPDLTLVIDLPVDIGLARARTRAGVEDRYEKMGSAFHTRMRDGFLQIAKAAPNRCVIIDGTGAIAQITHSIWQTVTSRFALTDG